MNQINVTWDGESYKIKENDVFALGEQIEEIVTLQELSEMGAHPKFRKLARCYAVMVNYAGGHVTPQEVHSMMMSELKSAKPQEKEIMVAEAVSTLVEIIMDGAPISEQDGPSEKKRTSSSKAAS